MVQLCLHVMRLVGVYLNDSLYWWPSWARNLSWVMISRMIILLLIVVTKID